MTAAWTKVAPAASASVNAAMTVSPAPVTSTAWSDPIDGKVAGLPARFKQGHAIASPRHQQCLESLAVEEFSSQSVETLQIMPNRLAKRRLDLGFIGRGRGEVLIRQKIVAGIDGDGQCFAARAPAKGIHLLGVGRVVTVIGNQQARGGFEQSRRCAGQAALAPPQPGVGPAPDRCARSAGVASAKALPVFASSWA